MNRSLYRTLSLGLHPELRCATCCSKRSHWDFAPSGSKRASVGYVRFRSPKFTAA